MSGSLTNGLSDTTGTVVGSGSDAITLLMSGDSYGPGAGADAEFTVNVDGQQIGGLQEVSAQKSAGQDQTFTFLGNYGPGTHDVTVTFANNVGTQGDKTDYGRGGDRNLYVDGVAYNGQVVSDSTTGIYASPLFPPNGPYNSGNAVFTVDDTTTVPADAPSTPSTTPGSVDVGSGSDTLSLSMSEDPFEGDAQFTVSVDGQQVGGTLTTTAIAWQGQAQNFNLHGDWGSGSHDVTVTFLNDAAGSFVDGLALDNADRNLYVLGVSYDGIQASGTPWELASNGSQGFSIPSGGQPGGYVDSGTSSGSGSTTTDNNTSGGSSGTGGSEDSSGSSSGSASGGGTTTGDNATVTGDSLGSGSEGTDSSGSGSGMTFIPPDGSSSGSGSSASGDANVDGGTNTGTTDMSGSSDNWWSNLSSKDWANVTSVLNQVASDPSSPLATAVNGWLSSHNIDPSTIGGWSGSDHGSWNYSHS